MNRTLLAALNEARAAKRRVCLVRYLEGAGEALVVDGATVMGEVPPDVVEAVATALRRDQSMAVDTGRGRAFLQVLNPPLRLIVIGAVGAEHGDPDRRREEELDRLHDERLSEVLLQSSGGLERGGHRDSLLGHPCRRSGAVGEPADPTTSCRRRTVHPCCCLVEVVAKVGI